MKGEHTSSQSSLPRRAAEWLRMQVTAFLASMQFLTLVPPVIRRPFRPGELGQAVGYFPLVGAALGGLLAGMNLLLGACLHGGVTPALLVAAWVVLTGALHLDGFLDACDGLFGGHTLEARLRILRDERVGAYGLAGGVLLLLLKYCALAALPRRTAALILAPTLGRWGISLALVAFPYARQQGLGRAMKDHAGGRQAILATVVALAAAWFGAGLPGLVGLAVAGAVAWAAARFAQSRLSGLTGDIYGAICELVEVTVLLVLVALGGMNGIRP